MPFPLRSDGLSESLTVAGGCWESGREMIQVGDEEEHRLIERKRERQEGSSLTLGAGARVLFRVQWKRHRCASRSNYGTVMILVC